MYPHEWLIFMGFHVGKYTIFPWILWVRDHGGLQPRPSKGVSHCFFFFAPFKLWLGWWMLDVGGMRSWVLR